ncbi:MAG TPA: hypothetical protein VG798_02450 [Rhizomicrobium sp.]|nr:hypothetical protein [Rhizomicrobium sp.]HWC62400.1 hypothetical protein [Rhizomicrobium sp.]
MPMQQPDREYFLNKAGEAEDHAFLAKADFEHRAWRRIAEEYRRLAFLEQVVADRINPPSGGHAHP